MQAPPNVLIVAQADIFADDPNAAEWLDKVDTLIALSLFPDELTARAKVALPIQSFAERDGTFTNGERRVQRFYTAQGPMGAALPAWQALRAHRRTARSGARQAFGGGGHARNHAERPGVRRSAAISELAKVPRQFPDVGGSDLYYGGTAYKNTGGIGVQIATEADGGDGGRGRRSQAGGMRPKTAKGNLLVVPTVRLYNRENTFLPSVEAADGGAHGRALRRNQRRRRQEAQDRRRRSGAGQRRREQRAGARARQRRSARRARCCCRVT